jgi:hypothetical protein
MDNSKVVSRYVGSMAGIATLHAIVAYFVLFRPADLGPVSDGLARWAGFLERLPKAQSSTWWLLAGLYLAVQGMAYGLAAAFPRRWAYRAVCFASSGAAASALALLYYRESRLPPFFLGALWQAGLALWVGWLLLLEAWHRPFAPKPPSPVPSLS